MGGNPDRHPVHRSQPNRHLDRFSRLCRALGCDHATTVAIGRIFPLGALKRCGLVMKTTSRPILPCYSKNLPGFGVRVRTKKGKGNPYSATECRVPELIHVLCSQLADDVELLNPAVGCHYFPPGLQLPSKPVRRLLPISRLGEQRHDGVNSLPKTVTRQRRGCDLNPGPTAPESSTLTTRLPG